MANHGTRTRFNQGCTDGADGSACDPCKKANRDYFKKYGQDKKAEKLGTVTNLPSAKSDKEPLPEIGPCEAAVIKTLEGVPAAANRPDLVASARAMAKLQDNPLYAAQQTAASKQLQALMTELMKGTERKGRLATVRQMSRPESATG